MSPKKLVAGKSTAPAKPTRQKFKTGLLPDPSLNISIDEYTTFATHLRSSKSILALLGAGLSAPSGIPTFRGHGGYWNQHDATTLAAPEAFVENPSTVWQFYHHRRLTTLQAKPNRAHYALARLAQEKAEDFLAITQNIDGLSERAGHVESSLQRVHGSLHQVKCSSKECDWKKDLYPDERLSPALPLDMNYEGTDHPVQTIPEADLPRCLECGLLARPGVVWFGEPLQAESRDRIHSWLDRHPKVDLMLVVGTSAVVYPAAAYIHSARVQGARVAVFNTEEPSEEDQDNPVTALRDGLDWFFKGSAAETLPDLLKEVIGKVKERDE